MAMQTNGTNNPRQTVHKGFTLLELLIVSSLISILFALLLPAIQMAQKAVSNSQRLSNLNQVEPELPHLPAAQEIPQSWQKSERDRTTIQTPGRNGSLSPGTTRPDLTDFPFRTLVTRSRKEVIGEF